MQKQAYRTQEVEPEMVKYASPGVVCLNKDDDPRGCSSLWDAAEDRLQRAHPSKIVLDALL